jgi:hypothetical protein
MIALLLVSSITNAGFFKGTDLKEHCFRDGYYHQGLCLGYIMGIYDGIILMESTWQVDNRSICLPKKTKSEEFKNVVVKLLNDEEVENIQHDASDIVWPARFIADAFN